MPNPRKARLDAIEHRLTGPKKIALFGHRAVGKTTLLAMFYREAAAGRVPGVRLAAVDSRSAEYLAEKIAQIESGEPPAGTLAETELALRLYHGPGKLDLIVKDYQGEHVTLGTDAPIQAFFADCDAVLLCLDPDPAAGPADRTRRQQEVEQLLERYLERSDDLTADRPVALLVTKYDRVLDAGGPPPDQVEKLVAERHGMTLHALERHVPGGAVFAVSAYGREAHGENRPPADLHPLGLEGPLLWLADRLEEKDKAQLDWLWDLAPEDYPRLSRCIRAFDQRYPKSTDVIDLRRRLVRLRDRRLRRGALKLIAAAALVVAAVVGYDDLGFRQALAFETNTNHPAPSVERRWSEFLAWHPSQPYLFPKQADLAAHKLAEWRIKAAGVRLAVGTEAADASGNLDSIKEQAPDLAPEVRKLEIARRSALHDRRWGEIVASRSSGDPPEKALASLRGFLHDFPETSHRLVAEKEAETLSIRVAERRDAGDRRALSAIRQAGTLPDADLADLIRQTKAFVDEHPESRFLADAQALLADYARRLDDSQFDRARAASKQYPTNFALRIRKYQEYLDSHRGGGRHVSESMEAIDRVERERDTYMYRLAYDHYSAHPGELDAVVRLLRSYLDANPQGKHAKDAQAFLKWHEKVSIPGEYHVTLRRGEVESDVGKYLAGGGPDLGVEVWVAGTKYGPSPIARNTHRPVWDHTFARPVKWKLGDPIVIKIVDYDWSASPVFTLNSPKGDPLSMTMLSGTVRPSKGGATHLVFSSDFPLPTLPKPE